MPSRPFCALVLGAFLARLALPVLHVHEGAHPETAHECRHDAAPAERVADASDAEPCVVCELLAVQTPALEPPPALEVHRAAPARGPRTPSPSDAPRTALLSLAGAPRGPPVV
jgi:hypothetical protein